MALTAEELEAAVREHVRAEESRDLDAIRATLDEDVEYVIRTPACSDDPEPYGLFGGADVYLAMWERLYETFAVYDIELLDVVVNVERRQTFITLHNTAVPANDWNGIPAGQRISWWPAAICEFAEDGRMIRETVFGSLPPFLEGYRRMTEFAAAR